MKIVCPQCGFSREVPEERLPKGTAIATCPKCVCRFRLAGPDGFVEILDSKDMVDKKPAMDGQAGAAGEENIRAMASNAYAAEAGRFRREHDAAQGSEAAAAGRESRSNPWDRAPGGRGWAAAFCQTALGVMFAAPRFFRGLNPQTQQTRPLLFYLLICAFQTVIERIWGGIFATMLAPGAASDPQLEKMLAMLTPETSLAFALLLRCGMLVLQLYVLSLLMSMAYRLVAPGRATFSLVFQIMAYSSAPSLLCVVPGIGSLAGALWGMACLAIGCKTALDLDWPKTLAGFLPMALLLALMLPQLLGVLQK